MSCINKARPAGFEQNPNVGCVALRKLLNLQRVLDTHTEMRHLVHNPPHDKVTRKICSPVAQVFGSARSPPVSVSPGLEVYLG